MGRRESFSRGAFGPALQAHARLHRRARTRSRTHARPRSLPLCTADDYELGNLLFDPLNLKPTDPEEYKVMQTKEL